MTSSVSVEIRRLGPADLSELLRVEAASYATPWTSRMFAAEFARSTSCHLGAFHRGDLTGFAIVSMIGDDWHVMNVAVDPERRRAGIAWALLDAVLVEIGPAPVTLEVRVSNTPAIALYEHAGFTIHGRRPRYYSDTGEDAFVMWRGRDAGSR